MPLKPRYLLLCGSLVAAACEVPFLVHESPPEAASGAGGSAAGMTPDAGAPSSGGSGVPEGGQPSAAGSTSSGAGDGGHPSGGEAGDAGEGGAGGVNDTLAPCLAGKELIATSVSAGEEHACAIQASTGNLYCWGSGQSGQLGNGDTQDSSFPVLSLPERVYTKVRVGTVTTCALTGDKVLYCVGDNYEGVLTGGLDQGSSSEPLEIELPGVDDFALNGGQVLARVGNALYSWGSNEYGQLGVGDDDTVGEPVKEVRAVSMSVNAQLLSVGYGHACISDADTGFPYCAGTNQDFRLGIDDGQPRTSFSIVTQARVSRLAAGRDRTCAILLGGTLSCWGKNEPITFAERPPELKMPMQVGSQKNWVNVSVGFDHMCVSAQDRRLRCSGDNTTGELGNTLGASAEFVAPEPSFYSEDFAAGRHFTCAIRWPDSAVVCFGSNANGKLGRESNDPGPGAPGLVCLH